MKMLEVSTVAPTPDITDATKESDVSAEVTLVENSSDDDKPNSSRDDDTSKATAHV